MDGLRSPDPKPAAARRALDLAAAAAVVLAASVVATWPLAPNFTTHVTAHWDSFFGIWRLAWIADAVTLPGLTLFDAPIFYPQPRALALSDAILLPGVVSAPLRLAGLDPTPVYNIMLLAAMASSGVAMFLLVRSLTRRSDAAVVAGVIFAIAPYRLDHLDHLEMQMAAWMPLALWCWHRAVDSGSGRAAAGAIACFVLQWLSCIYYGLLFAPLLGLAMMIEWPSIAPSARRSIAITLAVAGVVGAILIAVYAMPYVQTRTEAGDRLQTDVVRYSATPLNYLAVSDINSLYGRWLSRFGEGERRFFPGLLALGGVAVAFAAGPWNRRRLMYAAAGAIAVDLSLGMNGLLFPILREWFVPFRGLRAPARAAIMTLLVISVFAGYGASWLFARLPPRVTTKCTALAVVLLILEYRIDTQLWEAPPPIHAPELGFARGSVVVDMPMAVPERFDLSRDAYYMSRHIGAWPSMINGYSGYYPAHYITFTDRIRGFPDDRAIREMARVGVDIVAVHERWYGAEFVPIVSALQQRRDVETVGAFQDGKWRIAVFHVLPPAS